MRQAVREALVQEFTPLVERLGGGAARVGLTLGEPLRCSRRKADAGRRRIGLGGQAEAAADRG
uniref:hypothetical protein n=1 Tax=Saccharothrix sp. NRRL B-16314 TaxID=1463825 RepID=UPI0005274A84